MAKISSVNNKSITGAEAIFIFKTTLKTAGWTVPRSSDGSTYNSSGDQITHGDSGADGMANNLAWFVIQSPNGEHQWCFQKEITDNAEWRVKISSLDGFTGGTPSATQVPSATDEQVLLGSGTDASPTMADLFPTDNTYRFHIIAENHSVGTAVPIYGFRAFSTMTVVGICRTLISQEPMNPDTFPELSSGTRTSPVVGDPDPCIYVCHYTSSTTVNVGSTLGYTSGTYWGSTTPKWYMWYKMNYGDEAWVTNRASIYTNSQGQLAPYEANDGLPSNPYNGSEDLLPICTGRGSGFSTQLGLKGFCNNITFKPVNKNYPDVVNITSGAMVYLGDIVVPWEDNTTPLV